MNDLGNLLQMILDLLKSWAGSFSDYATAVMEKLNLIEEDTDNLSDIKSNTDDIKDNTGAIITPVQSIQSTNSTIASDTTSIKNTVSGMSNQLTTIATNVGTASAFAEDCANNTLNIQDKVTTIASDTTQIRSNTNTVVTDLDKVYEALKWALVNIETTETVEDEDSVSFDTDMTEDLVSLNVGLEFTQSGTGDPSPDNVRPITGYSTMNLTVNGNNVSISLGSTIYRGVLDVINGKLIVAYVLISKNISDMDNTETYPGWRNSGIRSIIGAGIDGTNTDAVMNIGTSYSYNTKSTNDIIYLSRGDYNMSQTQWITNYPSLTVQLLVPYTTPLEITLTPQQVATIKGINTISTDTNGNVEVTYKESVKHYLDKQE